MDKWTRRRQCAVILCVCLALSLSCVGARQGEISLKDRSSVAGVGAALDAFSQAAESGDIGDSVFVRLKGYTSEIARDLLKRYDPLAVADVRVGHYLNIRSEPSMDGTVVGRLPRYAGCRILKRQGDWCKVVSGEVSGYASGRYLLTGREALQIGIREAVKTEAKGKNGKKTVSYRLREAAAYTIPAEEKKPSGGLRASLVGYAKQYLGNPYVWGGTSLTRGADCSGFTLSVYRHFGVSLPHSSRAQAQMGKVVSASQMRPGDLVFYSPGGIHHVAIYIGDGQIIHAANSRKGIILSQWNYMSPARIVDVLGDR